MTKTAHFNSDALRFLADLAAHNDRVWFETSRPRFEQSLRDPFLRFIEDLKPRLAKVNGRFVVDASPSGGSLARIHRDMRFVRDGRPFKTALSAHFAHDKAREGARPSFFLYLEPGLTRVGGGVRNPDSAARKKLKRAVAANGAAWASANKKALEHGGVVDGFTVAVPIADRHVATVRFLDEVVEACRRVEPFVRFVASAVGARM